MKQKRFHEGQTWKHFDKRTTVVIKTTGRLIGFGTQSNLKYLRGDIIKRQYRKQIVAGLGSGRFSKLWRAFKFSKQVGLEVFPDLLQVYITKDDISFKLLYDHLYMLTLCFLECIFWKWFVNFIQTLIRITMDYLQCQTCTVFV